jgi:tRNA U34 5-carboxymethylaminomethyl modifying GTPase MnmE/TrmE
MLEALVLCTNKLEQAQVRATLEGKRTISIAVMGQTGIGKSSLINALFNTALKTDPVRPCTREIQRVVVEGEDCQLWIDDMPGIGREGRINYNYLRTYREKLEDADLVLWAIHGDCRPVASDLEVLQRMLVGFTREYRAKLVSKIVFVMTKVDVLSTPPWALVKLQEQGFFMPHPQTEKFLTQKAAYYQDLFLQPHAKMLEARTFHDGSFDIAGAGLRYDEHQVYYQGIMDTETLQNLQQHFPQHKEVFQRLYNYYRIPFCSIRLRYNLNEVLEVIGQKLEAQLSGGIDQFGRGRLNHRVSFEQARSYPNLVIFKPNPLG